MSFVEFKDVYKRYRMGDVVISAVEDLAKNLKQ